MSGTQIISNYELFTDINGEPLDAGYVWIGQPNTDPRVFPLPVYFDAALTIPAAMPLRTSNGYIDYSGARTFVYIDGNYSIRVENKNTSLIYEVADFVATGNRLDASLVGFNPSLAYPANTVGAAIGWIDSRAFGILANGTDETAALLAAVAKLKNTGKTLRIATGTVRITAAVTIEGMTLSMSSTAQIELFGNVSTPFNGGGIIVGVGATLNGGIIYTNGSMAADAGTKAVRQLAGEIIGVTVYSQLDEVVNHTAGYLDVMMYGGKSRGVRSQPSTDVAITYNVRWFNIGIRYVNKLAVAGVPVDSRAFHFFPQIAITKPVQITIFADYSWKNAAWVGGTSFPATNVIITGRINRAGYYINEFGVETFGNGAGTAIEVENCPGAIMDKCVTTFPAGYNIAIVGGSHGAKIADGIQTGNGGDPVVAIVNSNDTEVGGLLMNGTVGVSVGEGTVVNNTNITADIRNMTAAPITFYAGVGLNFTGSISGEPTLASFTGSWTGPGEVKSMLIAYDGAQDIVFAPRSVQGWFNYDVIDRSNVPGRLRVYRSGPSYAAPVLSRNDISLQKFSRIGTSAKYLRMIDSDTTGHSGVGEFALPGSGASFGSMVLDASMTNMTDFDITGTTLAAVRAKYAIQVCVKFVIGMTGNRIGFSLQDGTGVTPHSPEIFYSPFGVAPTPSSNSIQGVLHNLVDGEWVVLNMPLENVIFTGSNPAALTRFLVWKLDNAATYDLTITKPVLVFVGTAEK